MGKAVGACPRLLCCSGREDAGRFLCPEIYSAIWGGRLRLCKNIFYTEFVKCQLDLIGLDLLLAFLSPLFLSSKTNMLIRRTCSFVY